MKPARPCIWRAIRLVLVLTPSVGPLLYGSVNAAQAGSADLRDPVRERVGISGARRQELSEVPDTGGKLGHRGAGGGELGQELVMLGLEVVGPGQQHPGESACGDVAAVGVRAALADVLVQEVQAAREPEGPDLFEEVQDRDGGVLGPASAQVLALGVNEAGAERSHTVTGVFRSVSRPVYDDQVRDRIRRARTAGGPDLDGLLRGRDTWTGGGGVTLGGGRCPRRPPVRARRGGGGARSRRPRSSPPPTPPAPGRGRRAGGRGSRPPCGGR